MDRVLPLAYRSSWKLLEEEDAIRKKEQEAANARREAREQHEARKRKEVSRHGVVLPSWCRTRSGPLSSA